MTHRATSLRNDPVVVPASPFAPPFVSYLVREGVWRLEEPWHYDDGDRTIFIASGFRFDLASIPRLLWRVLAPFELSVSAPLVHDTLYAHQGDAPGTRPPYAYSRKEADRLFLRIMEEEGVPRWRRRAAYAAVRLFGGAAWNRKRTPA